ncbi:MAG: glycosyltransferase [Planctomycetes bacterium]|nr:glycosyltransferase [Planctomycetota bacterium]
MHVLVLPSGYPTLSAPLGYLFFAEQARAFARRGFKVGVVYPEIRSLRQLSPAALLESRLQVEASFTPEGVQQLAWRAWNPGHARLRHRLFVSAARCLFQRYVSEHGKPDLIHCQGVMWGGIAGQALAEEFGLPFVVTLHSSAVLRGGLALWKRALVTRTLAQAARVFAVSRALAAEASALALGAKIEVCPNFVDTDFFTGPERGPPTGPLSLLAVGRLIPLKGHDLLLAALARSQSDAELRLVGAGDQEPALRAQARRLGLEGRVCFLGELDRERLRQEYERAHALVHPSRLETFGVVIVEALAMGLPVLATACGGPQDIVTPDLGYLVPPDDVGCLTEALNELQATYSTHWISAGDHLRAVAVERYSDESLVSRLGEVFRCVIGTKPGRG